MIRVRLREVIDDYRLRTGEVMTYSRLARLTGLSQQTLESVASRPGYNSTLSTIAKLCGVLGCQPGDLLIFEQDDSDAHQDR